MACLSPFTVARDAARRSAALGLALARPLTPQGICAGGGGDEAPPAVQAAQLAAWTAPLKQPAGTVAASPPVSVPPPRRRSGQPPHVPPHVVQQPVATPNAQPKRGPAAGQPQQHEAPGDGWVHVSMPAAEGPEATAEAVAPQSGGLVGPALAVLSQVRSA